MAPKQSGAIPKRQIPDVSHSVGSGNAGQTRAAKERILRDAGPALGDREAGQSAAAGKYTPSQVGRAVRDSDSQVGQAQAAGKRPVPDAGQAVGDGEAGQAIDTRKRWVSDGGDRQTLNGIWNNQRTAVTKVSRNGLRIPEEQRNCWRSRKRWHGHVGEGALISTECFAL